MDFWSILLIFGLQILLVLDRVFSVEFAVAKQKVFYVKFNKNFTKILIKVKRKEEKNVR